MNTIDLYLFIFALGFVFWLLYWLYITIRIKKFIVKRYSQETDLLKKRYFTHHATFAPYYPEFFASTAYSVHLILCLWGWRFLRSRKIFIDVKKPEEVTSHFSKKEICMVKKGIVARIILMVHFIGMGILKVTMPELFNH